jgi:predicted transposase YdaD
MQRNDSLWKSVLEDVFDDFLRFMHPNADEIFDFTRPPEFLDKELEQLFPPRKQKNAVKIVDKLAKVYTRDGTEEWVLIHCEVQGEYKYDFPQRMYTYFCRIFDKYGKRISAYAILTEDTPKERTNKYVTEFLGTKIEYQYNVYKISQQSESELLKSNNPFAMVALTVRSVLKNKNLDDAALMEIKLKLAKRFLSMSLPKEKIISIMTFLNDYIDFEKEENSIIFDEKLEQIKGRKETMGIVEQVMAEREKRGIKRGKIEGIKLGEKRGIERRNHEVITNMLHNNFPDEMIVKATAVTPDYVQQIRASLK